MPTRAEQLREAPFSYAEVGATESELPPGYSHLDRARLIGLGHQRFTEAAERLLRWEVQTGAGLGVRSEAERAAPDVIVQVGVGVGPLRLWSPCRVVLVADEDDRRGFCYGTLPGHPEVGEESFMISIDNHQHVWLRVRAFSHPGPWWARALGPVGVSAQRMITDRYLRALD